MRKCAILLHRLSSQTIARPQHFRVRIGSNRVGGEASESTVALGDVERADPGIEVLGQKAKHDVA